MAFTDTQKVAIRRYCGFPAYGGQPVQAFGHRFFTHYGTLEFRINNMSSEEETQVTTYLTNLATLESDLLGTRSNIDTAKAAVWDRNKYELRERTQIYNQWRRELCNFIGIPPGPGLAQSGGIELVV